MAGIFGIQDYSGSLGIADSIRHFAASAGGSMDIPSHIIWDRHQAIGSVCLPHYGVQWPQSTQDGTRALAIFGRIYLPSGEGVDQTNFEAAFLDPLFKSRDELLSSLSGSFVFAVLDEKQCIIANDACGTFGLHYARTDSAFSFSTQLLSLRGITKDNGFDERGLFEQLALYQSLSGRTLFRRIKRPARGTLVVASSSGIKEHSYLPRNVFPSADLKSTLSQVERLLSHSVQRVTSSPLATASLSSGFDTRLTWSMILAQNRREITANTHGVPNSIDLKRSRKITAHFGIPNDILELTPDVIAQLPKLWRQYVTLTEGLYPLWQVQTLYVAKHLSEHFRVVIDSTGGALYRRQVHKYLEPKLSARRSLASQLLMRDSSPLIRTSIFKPDARQAMLNKALEGLEEFYAEQDHLTSIGDKIDMYYLDQLIAMRESFEANLQMNFIGVEHPLLVWPAIDLARQIPIAARRREIVHKYIVHASMPALERFWLDWSGFPVPYRGFSTFRFAGPAIELLLRKSERVLPFLRQVSLRRPVLDSNQVLKSGFAVAREVLLAPHPKYNDLIDRLELERVLRSFEEQNRHGIALLHLLTYRLFLDIFY